MRALHIIIYFVYLTSSHLFCQDTLSIIKGKVIDAATRLPIKNAAVSVTGSLRGTLTDSIGNFSVSFPGKETTLRFSIIGYEKKSVKINNDSAGSLIVELTRKINNLSEVVVSASAIQTVSKSKRFNVLDYDFYGTNILLITYVDLSKSKLILMSQRFDTLGYIAIPHEPTRLFKDCLGNDYVVCKDSVYQVYYDYDTDNLRLFPAKSIDMFEQRVLPCVAQDSFNLYVQKKMGSHVVNDFFKKFKSNSYIVSYTGINKETRARTELAIIGDDKILKWQAEEDSRIAQKSAAGLYAHSPAWADKIFAETIIFTEIYAQLYNINNRLYIFDYVNNSIKCYNRAYQLDHEVPIEFHKSLHFNKEMHIDKVTAKPYALFESGGIIELKEINLTSGQINASYKIPFPFVSHVKVQDSYIYFIYKGKDYEDTRYLSRLRIN